jgi:hypothetical protein
MTRCPCEAHDPRRRHLALVLVARNHTPGLRTLKGPAPAQVFGKEWPSKPERFHEMPCHPVTGRTIQSSRLRSRQETRTRG